MNRIAQQASAAFLLLGPLAASTAAQGPPNRPWHPRPAGAPAAAAPASPAPQVSPPAATSPGPLPNPYATVAGKKTPAGEQFFIVASVDLQKSQLLLKYPTEVTLLVRTTDQTRLLDDAGMPIKLSDFRAGDTVWVTSAGSGDSALATKVRKGQMTVADLHRYYLDYPAIK